VIVKDYHILFVLIIMDVFYVNLMNVYNYFVHRNLVRLCMYEVMVIMDVGILMVRIRLGCRNRGVGREFVRKFIRRSLFGLFCLILCPLYFVIIVGLYIDIIINAYVCIYNMIIIMLQSYNI
jgi:hypothetical protein